MESLRKKLRRSPRWVKFRDLTREGFGRAMRREWYQRKILDTRPVLTSQEGPRSVHVLTWHRDWMNALWSLKSFYHFAGVDYPLFIHDGGLEKGDADRLLTHFPAARFFSRSDSDERVRGFLRKNGFKKCEEYRDRNPAARKIFDFFILGSSSHLISIDPDIVFFARPSELLEEYPEKNLYNRDMDYAYSLPPDEMEKSFGFSPPPLINSGLFLAARASMCFPKVERWLEHPKLFEDRWVTEQTLHALSSAVYGVELLPATYRVSTKPGLAPGLVCKHYPGYFRPLLYSEGMRHLARGTDFLSVLSEESEP